MLSYSLPRFVSLYPVVPSSIPAGQLCLLPGQLFLPTHYSIASYVSLLPGRLIKSDIPIEAKFQVSPLSWVGGLKLKLNLNSAQLKLELGLSLATINKVIRCISLIIYSDNLFMLIFLKMIVLTVTINVTVNCSLIYL